MDKKLSPKQPVVQLSLDQRKAEYNNALQPYTLLFYRWTIVAGGAHRLHVTDQNPLNRKLVIDCDKRSDFNTSFEQAIVELKERYPDLQILGQAPNTNYLICKHYNFDTNN